jgi:hypothetical protein
MGQHYGQLCSRVLDNMDIDGSVRTLSRFGQIYDSGSNHGFIYWFREWFKDKGTLWMLITQEMARTMLMDSKLADIVLDTYSAYKSSHSKQSNAHK